VTNSRYVFGENLVVRAQTDEKLLRSAENPEPDEDPSYNTKVTVWRMPRHSSHLILLWERDFPSPAPNLFSRFIGSETYLVMDKRDSCAGKHYFNAENGKYVLDSSAEPAVELADLGRGIFIGIPRVAGVESFADCFQEAGIERVLIARVTYGSPEGPIARLMVVGPRPNGLDPFDDPMPHVEMVSEEGATRGEDYDSHQK